MRKRGWWDGGPVPASSPLLFVFPACVFLAAKGRPAVDQKHLGQIGDASVGMECIL